MIIEDGDEPPISFEDLPLHVRRMLKGMDPGGAEAVGAIRPRDVSVLRSDSRRQLVEGAGMNGDPIKQLQTSFIRWIMGLFATGIVAFLGAAFFVYSAVGELKNAQKADEEWKAAHLSFHRDRQKENADIATAMSSRLATIEGQLPQIGQHNYRIGQVEEGLRQTNARIDGTLSTMAKQLSDLATNFAVFQTRYEAERSRNQPQRGGEQR